MPFVQGNFGQGTNSWEQYRQRLLAQQGANGAETGTQDSANLPTPFQATQSAGVSPVIQSLGAGAGGTNVAPPPAVASVPAASGDGAYSDIPGGRYYSGYTGSTIGKLAGDPATAAREWAKYTGTGGSAYARYLSSVFSDPMAVLRAQGVDTGRLDEAGVPRLNEFSHLWDRLSGRTQNNGLNQTVNVRGMLDNIYNAKMPTSGGKANDLGHLLDNPDLMPEEQVKNVIGLTLASLQGFVSDEALNAWSSMMNEFAQNWLSLRNQDPSKWDKSETFLDAVKKQYGSHAGLL